MPYFWSVALTAVAVLLVNVAFMVSMICSGFEAHLTLLYLAFLLFHAALYLRRRLGLRNPGLGVGLLRGRYRRHGSGGLGRRLRNQVAGFLRRHRRRAGLRRGLGYAAIVLGAFMSALFFCSFAPAAMPPSLRAVVWLGLAVAEYFFYRLTVLHLEDDEDELVVQGQVNLMRLLPL